MHDAYPYLIALGIFGLIILGFFGIFRGEGSFKISSILGKLSASGKNPPTATTIASGVKTGTITAGTDVTAHSSSGGGVETGNVKAEGSVSVTHMPGQPPPKK